MLIPRRSASRHPDETLNIPSKANRILNLILIGMLLIVLRLWHLSVVQYEKRLEEATKPQRRVISEAAKRGTITDRFNLPLAVNKMQYNVAILYSQIRQIPGVVWEKDAEGNRVKRQKRKEYILALSQLLGDELDMDAERIEDLIYAKAALYNQIPFVLREGIDEKQYYRLKMLEKDWVGIQTQSVPRRYYPLGKIAGDIVGYIGAINHREYESIIHEMKELERYIAASEAGEEVVFPKGIETIEQAGQRLKDLHELAYSVSDLIGKAGIESRFEERLRGFRGKKSFYSDARGNFLRELPGTHDPLSGAHISLTISAELQEFAETLLIQNESIRQTRLSPLNAVKRTIMAAKQPWIKGGAIVAIDPNNGEILAMATHPRFDPNDFVFFGSVENRKQQKARLNKWLESEVYLAEVWNQQRPLEREVYDKGQKKIVQEEMMMTWENYLNTILSKNSSLRNTILFSGTIKDAVELQNSSQQLLESSSAKENYDSVLLVDLVRLLVPSELFSSELLHEIGSQTLSEYKNASAAMVTIKEAVKKLVRDHFHETEFKTWRKNHEKEFLKAKRLEEKIAHRYTKPYIEYLDTIENEMFQTFWKKHSAYLTVTFLTGYEWPLLSELRSYEENLRHWQQEVAQGAHQKSEWITAYYLLSTILKPMSSKLAVEYVQTMRDFRDLDQPLLGKYRFLRKNGTGQMQKHLAAAFYPKYGFGYGRSQAYRQATTQGSLFKLITAYAALSQKYQQQIDLGKSLEDLNPLNMVDLVYNKGKSLYLGYDSLGNPLPRHYKGGRLPRSINTKVGQLDLLKAIETSSNPYFALLAGEVLDSPKDLANAAKNFSFGSRTGLDLPGEISGKIPEDLETNRTGLYAFAIGQHTFVVTPLQTSLMLSTLANGGKLLKPRIVMTEKNLAEIRNTIFLPRAIQQILLDGMCRVVTKSHGESLKGISSLYRKFPEAIHDYVEFKHQLLGKTSTAESVENIDLDLNEGTNIYTHVWFGSIVYDQNVFDQTGQRFVYHDSTGTPELVVVVYLRYGGYGKEAAPLAAQISKKWREIKALHNVPIDDLQK